MPTSINTNSGKINTTVPEVVTADPLNPAEGQLWYDTSDGELETYVNGQVEIVHTGNVDIAFIDNVGDYTLIFDNALI